LTFDLSDHANHTARNLALGRRDWKFFSTDQNVEYLGHTYQGLALPRPVLRKLFHDNAVRWFPGLVGGAN